MISPIAKIASLDFPSDQYCVIGSSVLAIHSIRDFSDIDLLVTSNLFEKCRQNNWQLKTYPDSFQTLSRDCFELLTIYAKKFTLSDVSQIEFFDQIPFMSLSDLARWKKLLGRPKDLADIALIEEYQKSNKVL